VLAAKVVKVKGLSCRYLLKKGEGPSVQRSGRHGVVHFAERAPIAPSAGGRAAATPPPSINTRDSTSEGIRPGPPATAVAIKFYTNHAAFDAVEEIYSAAATRKCMGAVREVLRNVRRVSTGAHVLPACVVTQCGENLSVWARRVKPTVPIALQALAGIADRIAALHACGYVCYAVKAPDIVWLEEQQEWQLADFGAVMKVGAC
jgi:hypothetical protein